MKKRKPKKGNWTFDRRLQERAPKQCHLLLTGDTNVLSIIYGGFFFLVGCFYRVCW